MKARRKLDGKIVDVEPHGWRDGKVISYHSGFKDFYKSEDLVFNIVETEPEDVIQSISKVLIGKYLELMLLRVFFVL